MAEPALDLSEIMDLYKEDARRMVGQMRIAQACWEEVQQGGPARQELRKLSHQMRGSGRTYGFREATRLCKAIENIIQKLEKNKLPADERIRKSLHLKIERLAAVFSAAETLADPPKRSGGA
jgi:chemotaxis protein histidine kinase CheA